jgi:hypothetical protein
MSVSQRKRPTSWAPYMSRCKACWDAKLAWATTRIHCPDCRERDSQRKATKRQRRRAAGPSERASEASATGVRPGAEGAAESSG